MQERSPAASELDCCFIGRSGSAAIRGFSRFITCRPADAVSLLPHAGPLQDEAPAENYAEGFAGAPAAIAEAAWDAADVAVGYDGSAPAAGQWSEQAAAGWDAAAAPAAVDFNTGAMEFSAGSYA